MKNNSQGINSRAADPKNQNSDLEYNKAKHIQSEQQKEKKSKKMRIV